jgi:DNA-binding transcriptional MerR regulator
MAKNQRKLFYKIGEVCRICEVEPHVLRYWETVFTRLRPNKNTAGQRIYRRSDIELIENIKSLLYEQGYTIAGANARLQQEALGQRDDLPLFHGALEGAKRRALQEIKRELDEIERLLAESPGRDSLEADQT